MRKPQLFPGASRRDFLLQSLVAAALTVAAGRVPAAESAPATDAARAVRVFAAIAFLLYPHASLPAEVYADVAATLRAKAAAEPALQTMLDAGLRELDAAAGGDWLALSAPARLAALRERQTGSFFQFVRGVTALTLYSSPLVWKRLGYGGDAWSFGGYGGKALDDIDWLPEPAAGAG